MVHAYPAAPEQSGDQGQRMPDEIEVHEPTSRDKEAIAKPGYLLCPGRSRIWSGGQLVNIIAPSAQRMVRPALMLVCAWGPWPGRYASTPTPRQCPPKTSRSFLSWRPRSEWLALAVTSRQRCSRILFIENTRGRPVGADREWRLWPHSRASPLEEDPHDLHPRRAPQQANLSTLDPTIYYPHVDDPPLGGHHRHRDPRPPVLRLPAARPAPQQAPGKV